MITLPVNISILNGVEQKETHIGIIIGFDNDGNPLMYHQWGSRQYIETVNRFVKRHRLIAKPVPISMTRVIRYPYLENYYKRKKDLSKSPLLQYLAEI